MPVFYGTIRVICSYCCDDIKDGEAWEPARHIPGSPINGATIHATCARQRDHANEPHSTMSE